MSSDTSVFSGSFSQLKSRDIVFYRDWSSATPERIGGIVNGRHCFIHDHCRFLRGGRELTVRATEKGLRVSIDGHTTDCQNVRISVDWSNALFNERELFERIGIDFDMDEYVAGDISDSDSKPLVSNVAAIRPE